MSVSYVGVDLGSSKFHQVALNHSGTPTLNREFTTIKQLYAVLDQSMASQTEAQMLMLRAAQALPEIRIMRTAPGVGPIGACRFSAYIHTPQRFSSTRKLWKYC